MLTTFLILLICCLRLVRSHLSISNIWRFLRASILSASEAQVNFSTIAAPAAVANAIEDVLLSFGVRIREFPLTQDRIWQLVSDATS